MKRKYCKVDRERGVKVCPECDTEKPVEEFPHRKDGTIYAYCKPCNSKRATAWAKSNRERKNKGERERRAKDPLINKNQHYRSKFGIEYSDVLALLEQQSFRCDICTTEISEGSLYVDHCHASGKIRGILCNRCNIGLASIERPGYLKSALSYLERHRSKS